VTAPRLAPPIPSSLFDKTTLWFERARAALLDNLPCRQGCHHCCIGLFPVTLLDRQMLRRGLRALPPEQRRAIEQKAADQTRTIYAAEPRLAGNPFIDQWPDQAIDDLAERYRDLPCPALQTDGSCGLYAFRPLACRSMGIPADTGGTTQGACEIQTFVPLVRLSRSLREEEDRLAQAEADELAALRRQAPTAGEEIMLPYAFLADDTGE
jgi:Fe-S-cluster containining protein